MAKAKPITGLAADAPTAENASVIAKTRLAEMYEWDEYADQPYRVRELHNLRIAAKRLRYTLEIFQSALSSDVAEIIHEVEQIQEELGALHDSDVMIALLRLCLGSQDGGSGYEYALAEAPRGQKRGKFAINPALVSHLLDPASAPTAEQRQGLEIMLNDLHHRRETQYAAFREHWYQLKARDFRREILHLLDT